MSGVIRASFQGGLGDFSLEVDITAPGQGITALFGPSGSGKTTLLRCIAGLNRLPGRLQVGDDIWQDDSDFLPVHRRPIGYVFQEASLFPHLSVQDNLNYGRRRALRGGVAPRVDFDEAVALLGLETLLARAPQHLSGGERQRVAMGRALLSQPQLLLMDEPLAALDRQSKDEILPYLERLHESLSIPVLYVSHAIHEVERLADQLILLHQGRVQAAGPLATLLADPRLPLSRAAEAATVLEGQVVAREAAYGLVHVQVGAQQLVLPGNQSLGQALRVRVGAADVSLGRHPPVDTSILNALPCRVLSHERVPTHQVTVVLGLGEHGDGARLLARLSAKSWDERGFTEGEPVYARIKAVSLG